MIRSRNMTEAAKVSMNRSKGERLSARLVFALSLLMLLSVMNGCSLLFNKPKTPEVFISGVRIESLALTEQVLLFKLKVHNPNDYPVPIRDLTYRIEVNDLFFAEGGNADAVTLPALGETEIELRARARSVQLLSQLTRMALRGESSIRYRVSGRLTLRKGNVGIDFKRDGMLPLPDIKSLPRRGQKPAAGST